MQPAPRAIRIPRLSAETDGALFHLAQPWRAHPEEKFRAGTVRLAWVPGTLIARADLQDDDVRTTAAADNQNLWELGDVFEIFLQAEGSPGYTELHVAPNGKKLHLRFPGKIPGDPAGFAASAAAIPGGWRIEALIPPGICGLPDFHAGQHLRVSFCRYDASGAGTPVLSTSSPHRVISFHRPEEWARAVLWEDRAPLDF